MEVWTCQKVTKLESCSKLLKYIDGKNIGPYFNHKIYIFNIYVFEKDMKPPVSYMYFFVTAFSNNKIYAVLDFLLRHDSSSNERTKTCMKCY